MYKPLAVESYGAWGPRAFSLVATRLAIRGNIQVHCQWYNSRTGDVVQIKGRVTETRTAMGFSVGDRVVCNADKVIGNKLAKQRYGSSGVARVVLMVGHTRGFLFREPCISFLKKFMFFTTVNLYQHINSSFFFFFPREANLSTTLHEALFSCQSYARVPYSCTEI